VCTNQTHDRSLESGSQRLLAARYLPAEANPRPLTKSRLGQSYVPPETAGAPDASVMRLLLKKNRPAGERLLKRILEPKLQMFNPPSLGEGQDAAPALREFLLSSTKCEVPPILLYARWLHMWYGPFPP
jgi:hypothetical protein